MPLKSIDIREYESLVADETVEEGIRTRRGIAISQRHFDALEEFVLENRNGKTEALDLLSLGARKGIGKTITAKNFVGLIEFKDGTSIQIWPKASPSEDFEEDKKIWVKMIQAVTDLPLKEFDSAALETVPMTMLEPFIQSFAKSVFGLAGKGLKGAYVEVEGNEKRLKGRLLFQEDVRINHSHRERFYVRYDEFTTNRPENRLIKTTLAQLERRANSPKVRQSVKSALELFSDIECSSNIDDDFNHCNLDRTMREYEPILRWCRIFLKGEGFTPFKGDEIAFSLLFPMETLFEAHVAKLCRRAACEKRYRFSAQDKGLHLFDKPRKMFGLRPDMVLWADERTVVLDTKWKMIGEGPHAGLSQSDFYQMYAYQHRYKAEKTILVYPLHSRLLKYRTEDFFKDYWGIERDTDNTDAHVQVFLFDLSVGKAESEAERLISLAFS